MVARLSMSQAARLSTDQTLADASVTHCILPVQFHVAPAAARTGEQRLMAAILEDAIALYFKQIGSGAPKLRSKLWREQREADHWLRSNDSASAFSFLRICEALHLDPQYLRRGLQTIDGKSVHRLRHLHPS
jgi:hypothetical protein